MGIKVELIPCVECGKLTYTGMVVSGDRLRCFDCVNAEKELEKRQSRQYVMSHELLKVLREHVRIPDTARKVVITLEGHKPAVVDCTYTADTARNPNEGEKRT